MDNQEAFSKVVRHLLTQYERSMLPDGSGCAYRGEGGKMCAVGCLIADTEYNSMWETFGVAQVISWTKSLDGLTINLLSRLQHVHDNEQPSMWFWSLALIARDYALKMPFDGVQVYEWEKAPEWVRDASPTTDDVDFVVIAHEEDRHTALHVAEKLAICDTMCADYNTSTYVYACCHA